MFTILYSSQDQSGEPTEWLPNRPTLPPIRVMELVWLTTCIRLEGQPILLQITKMIQHLFMSHCFFYRYGKIVSTKAILDKNTNQCKGEWASRDLTQCGYLSHLTNSDFHMRSASGKHQLRIDWTWQLQGRTISARQSEGVVLFL